MTYMRGNARPARQVGGGGGFAFAKATAGRSACTPLRERKISRGRGGVHVLRSTVALAKADPNRTDFEGADGNKGAFMEAILLHCKDPENATNVHSVEAFGPVATVMAYADNEQAVRLARKGGGSLVASLYSEDEELAKVLTFGLAPYHGRLVVMNEAGYAESTGHGSAMPQLVHGGPGRAGGGEELGGLRGLAHYMQRTALQGTPERLASLVQGAVGG